MEREAFIVKSGTEYDHLFPKALMTTIVTKKGATVEDTIKLIPKIVRETSWQARKFAAFIKGKNLHETCRNIWEFVYNQVAYKKDDRNKEQVRSFARTWNDRHNFLKDNKGNLLKDKNGNEIPGGVDCDCMTTFISTTLYVLGIKHALRIVKFWENHYQHIYPIVYLPDGGHITMDCVVKNFNYEEPYSEKKDTTMDLEYLNGVYDSGKNIDAIDMAESNENYNDIAGLGKLFKRASGGGSAPKKGIVKKVFQKGGLKQVVKSTAQNVKQTVKDVKSGGAKVLVKKVMNLTNKANPGAIPIRAGILAALKTNFFKIAQRLKYAYLSDAEAQNKGVDMGKLARLRQIRDKLENIFFDLGGNKANFKEAILTGRGNRNKDVVAGLGYTQGDLNGMSTDARISTLLGDMYYDEHINGLEGLGEVGEVATAAVIVAATGILGAIAVLLKQVGSMFPKKSKESQDFENIDAETTEAQKAASQEVMTDSTQNFTPPNPDMKNSPEITTSQNNTSTPRSEAESNIRTVNTNTGSGTNTQNTSDSSDTTSTANDSSDATDQTEKPATESGSNLPAKKEDITPGSNARTISFWQKNKNWIVPTSVGTGILLVSVISYKMLNRKPDPSRLQLSGTPDTRKKPKKKGGNKPKIKSKKTTVAYV